MSRVVLVHWMVMMIATIGAAQQDTIHLFNPSFEDIPRHSNGVRGWIDCGFPGETPPDVQPFESMDVQWGQEQIAAADGSTYLGLVVRDNDTYERVAQRLSATLEQGKCYSFSLMICSSSRYLSNAHSTNRLANYTEDAVVKIWAGHGPCQQSQLLDVTPTINNEKWQRFDFEFHPDDDYTHIMIEAHYKTPTLFVYNGNVLVDYASPIVQMTCPGEDPHIAVVEANPTPYEDPVSTAPSRPVKPARDDTKTSEIVKSVPNKIIAKELPKPIKPILENLSRNKITEGQRIRIKNLYFEANISDIDSASIPVLNEIAYFLAHHQDVHVEIGGHTNGKPTHEFCDKLSAERAKTVADYLYNLGLDEHQISYKGYGKRYPIATNQTQWGRERNQRVEIKIMKMHDHN